MNNLRTKSNALWRMIGSAAVELMRRRDSLGQPALLVRQTEEGPQACITVALEEPWRDIPALVCLCNATLSPNHLHHFEAFQIHPETVRAVNRRAVRESRASA